MESASTKRRRRRRRSTNTPTRQRTLAIAYCRVSTEEQRDSGASMAAQETALRSYATAKGWDIELVTADAGLSAKDLTRRPALTAALARLDQGGADVLLAVSWDRLSRRLGDIIDVMDRSLANGWALCTIKEDVDTGSPTGRLYVQIMGAVAEFERGRIGERVKAGMAQRRLERLAADPEFRWGPPTRLDPNTRARILNDHAAGLTPTQIARDLNDEQVPTAKGAAKWSQAVVWQLIAKAPRDADQSSLRQAAN